MSDLEKATAELGATSDDTLPQVSELDALKARADQVGLTYHPAIGVDKLRTKLNAFLAGEPEAPEAPEPGSAEAVVAAAMVAAAPTPAPAPTAAPVPAYKAASLAVDNPSFAVPKVVNYKAEADSMQPPRQEDEPVNAYRLRKRNHAMALIRVNVTCMNPFKREWDGEIFTAGNTLVGSVSKYVPFNTEEGWHIPRILYNMLRDRKCQIFVTVTDERKNKIRKGKMISEFSLQVLDPLTTEELAELAARQAATRAID